MDEENITSHEYSDGYDEGYHAAEREYIAVIQDLEDELIKLKKIIAHLSTV